MNHLQRLLTTALCVTSIVPAIAQQPTDTTPRPSSASNRFLNVVQRFQSDLGSLNRFYNVSESEARCERMIRFYANWTAGMKQFSTDQLSTDEQQTASRLQQRLNKDTVQLQNDLKLARQLKQQHPFSQQIIAIVEARQRIEPVNPRATAKAVSEITAQIAEATQHWKEAPDQHELTPQQTAEAFRNLKSHFSEWFRFYDGYAPMFSWWIRRPYEDCDQEFRKLLASLKQAAGEKDKTSTPESQTTAEATPQTTAATSGPAIDIEALLSPSGLLLPSQIANYSKEKANSRSRRSGRDAAASSEDKRQGIYDRWQKHLTEIDFDALQRTDQIDYLLLKYDIDYQLAKLALPQRNTEIKWSLPEDPRSMSAFPIGAEALQVELDHEMIRYSPEELVAIAEKELQWCRNELIKASNEMGLGDDWRAAVEQVKNMHVEPGQQPAMIKGLALDAINYLKANDRLSIPPIAEETWRMTMMSPERQLVNPFFLGGEVIQVSYPTDTMKHRDKLESMRGNNIPFARATVHHELIPGHHLQIFSSHRNKPYRRTFATPFWMEGWALYWEMMLYDAGFPKEAKDRIGFLVWRSHRCARIVFSLNFHLGKMSPPECVDLLVNWVGFDRNNAAAEVRRSVGKAYSPLYQAAYMLGGLQIRQLRKEIVDSGKMTEKQFHDAILQQNSIPISLLRAVLTDQPLTADQQFHWKFYGDNIQ